MVMSRRSLAVLLLCCLSLSMAHAKEGSDNYPHGAETWSAGAVPGPGFYYLNYFNYYAGKLKNGSGDNVLVAGSTPSVHAVGEAPRFLFVPNFKLFGGTYAMHLIVPVVRQSVNLGGEKSITSIGDLSIIPIALTYHSKQVHQYVALEFDPPTGHFNANDSRVSVGTGYLTIMPIYAVSYLPPSGWELSAKFMYDFHLKNSDTNYKSGQEFHADYLAGKHIGPWGIAAAGYFVEQTTDDSLNGATVAESSGIYSTGRRGQVLGVGPSASFTTKSHITFIGQYTRETLVENRFGGDKLLVKVIIPVSSLFGRH